MKDELKEKYRSLVSLYDELSRQMQDMRDQLDGISKQNTENRPDTDELQQECTQLEDAGVDVKADTSLQDKIDGLTALVQDRLAHAQEVGESRLERLEKIIQNVQEDRNRKDKSRLITRCIYQAGIIRKTILDYPLLRDTIEDKEAFLLDQLNRIADGIDNSLTAEGIEVCHFADVGQKVNPEFQEVVGTIPTDDETLNNTVAQIINPGYVWTLPYILKAKITDSGEEIKTYRFLMQAEQIMAYKLI